jgi:hypothetical protein
MSRDKSTRDNEDAGIRPLVALQVDAFPPSQCALASDPGASN